MIDKLKKFWAWFRWILAAGVGLFLGYGVYRSLDIYHSSERGKVDGKGRRWVTDPSDRHSILVETSREEYGLHRVALPENVTSEQVAKVDIQSGPKLTIEVRSSAKDRRKKP